MHYYQFNIGDYASHTSRLSLIEDLAYRRLLDLYYLNERPLNGCSTDVARDIGMLEHIPEVEYILGKFFTESGKEWINKRADREIKAYKNKQDMASKAGKASGEARKAASSERTFNGRSTDVQPNTKHKPLNKKQKDKRADAPVIPDWMPMEAWIGFVDMRNKIKKPMTARAVNLKLGILEKLKNEGHNLESVLDQSTANNWTDLYAPKKAVSVAKPTSSYDDAVSGAI